MVVGSAPLQLGGWEWEWVGSSEERLCYGRAIILAFRRKFFTGKASHK